MSELNKKEKKPFKLKVWMLFLIYLVVALSITFLLVFINKSAKENTDLETEVSPIIDENKELEEVRKITLKDKYAVNNLKIETISEDYGEIVAEYDFNNDSIFEDIDKRITIDYIQISGLKDKNVESKINKIIKDRVEEFKAEYMQEDKYPGKVNIYISTYSSGYANTLSVSVQAIAYEDITRGDSFYWESECLSYVEDAYNFRLDTGEEFSFEEIFTKDADINHILSQSIYENLVSSFKYVEPTEDGEYIWDLDMDNVDYGQIEVDLVREINRFKRNKDNLVFTLSNRYINIHYPTDNPDDYTALLFIDMYDFVEYIGIYTRFLTDESLFEGGDLEAKTYVFRYCVEDEYASGMQYEEISNNVLVQMSSYAGVGYEQQVEERKSKVKNYIIRNAEKDKVYIYGIYVSAEFNWEVANGNVQIMSKKFYEENKDYILRYLDNSYETYEEPMYDTEQIENRYFDIRFDENNNVIEFKYDNVFDEIESGTDEVIDESEQEIEDITNTNTIGDYTNSTNTVSDTVINSNIGNNTAVENVITNTAVTDSTNTTVENTTIDDSSNTTILNGFSSIDTSNVGE